VNKFGGKVKLYSYIIANDTGFSPNPFWGFCTLADCKPVIRRTADKGDWIVGLSSKATCNKIVYAMEVTEILSFSDYYKDKRFIKKIPDFEKNTVIHKSGDNIYEPLSNGNFKQKRSMHSKNKSETENPATKRSDLSGKNVLNSTNFYYFGSKAKNTHKYNLEALIVGRGHRNNFSLEVINNFKYFISKQKQKGLIARPSNWPKEDSYWSKGK